MIVIVEASGSDPMAATIMLCAMSPTNVCEPAPLPTVTEIRDARERARISQRWGGAVQRRGKHR